LNLIAKKQNRKKRQLSEVLKFLYSEQYPSLILVELENCLKKLDDSNVKLSAINKELDELDEKVKSAAIHKEKELEQLIKECDTFAETSAKQLNIIEELEQELGTQALELKQQSEQLCILKKGSLFFLKLQIISLHTQIKMISWRKFQR
jgi:hypothetical protein